MKTKIIFALIGVLVVCAGGFFYMQKSKPEETYDVQVGEMIGSGATTPLNETEQQALGQEMGNQGPQVSGDVSMGLVLFDEIKLEGVNGVKLATGDIVKVVQDSKEKNGFARVITKSGQTGLLPVDKFLLMAAWEDFNGFYYSTTPLTQVFSDEGASGDPEVKKKYDIVVSKEFLQRALENSDSTVVTWANELARMQMEEEKAKAGIEPQPEEAEPTPE